MQLDDQAKELNEKIGENNINVVEMLSKRGKAIYFPKKGILKQAAEAKGKKINSTIGFATENDGSPMRLNSIAENVSLDPKEVFSYASSYGKQELREKWQEMIYQKNPTLKGKTISLPSVTNAITHALSMAGYLFLDEGDEIIIPEPLWENYTLIFENGYGAKINLFDCFKDNSFNIEGLKEKLNEKGKKKVLVLNFPNNPSGYTPTEEDVKEIVGVVKESAEKGKNVVVIMDDSYFGLVYKEGVYEESIFSELADIHERVLAVKVDGITKEDYAWGLRVGFITFGVKGINKEVAQALEEKTTGAIRGSISNASHLSQSLALKAFSSESYRAEKKEKYEILKERFEEVENTLEQHKEYGEFFKPLLFNSGYFMCVVLKEGLDSEKVRKILLDKYDTGVIAVENILRVAFSSTKKELIPELFENIYKACKE